jgi:hypothetical protein
MKLYIQLLDGTPVNHPFLEDNLKDAWQVNEITNEILQEKGFAIFESATPPTGTEVLTSEGYELCADGIVRNKITVRDLTQEEKITLWIRRHRDFLLERSDWTQMPDAPLTAEKKAEWAAYRQELRDMTTTYANIQDPAEIVPPTQPAK